MRSRHRIAQKYAVLHHDDGGRFAIGYEYGPPVLTLVTWPPRVQVKYGTGVKCFATKRCPPDKDSVVVALHDLIAANLDWIVARTRRSKNVAGASVAEPQYEHGVRLFLTQLCERLRQAESSGPSAPDEIGASAALHGIELFGAGFTLSQVVHEYGDICQAITALAEEHEAEITVAEFRLLNRTLDTAIAQAVTAHSTIAGDSNAADEAERVGHAVRDLKASLDAAVSRFDAHAARRKYRHQ